MIYLTVWAYFQSRKEDGKYALTNGLQMGCEKLALFRFLLVASVMPVFRSPLQNSECVKCIRCRQDGTPYDEGGYLQALCRHGSPPGACLPAARSGQFTGPGVRW